MRKKLSKILVTGGAGFIGSAFVRMLVKQGQSLSGTVPNVIVVDNLTYAGDLKRLEEVKGRYKFYKADICNKKLMERIFLKEKPVAVVHFAAQTHVDRSIKDASPFIETNVKGTQILLDASRKHRVKRFIQTGTDEVYGETKFGSFSEDSPLKPNSPYAASKAAADLLVKAYIRTYNFPAIIVRPCNNYGAWQYPEKLIPLAISKILKNKKIPVYAKGENIREWLCVSDCAEAIFLILEKGKIGEVYNLGSGEEKQNIAIVRELLKLLGATDSLIEFVKDRLGHDIRYKLNSQKIFKQTRWRPKVKLKEGLRLTVNWCIRHKDWLLNKCIS